MVLKEPEPRLRAEIEEDAAAMYMAFTPEDIGHMLTAMKYAIARWPKIEEFDTEIKQEVVDLMFRLQDVYFFER